uniref:RRM domain-containing protein n=1 Tax=Ascaris lumbricoides TaxID=6252 RepID=A0A0M3I573_ASCLU
MSETDPSERTCYVSGLHEKVTKSLLEELFIQMGPLETVVLRSVGQANEGRAAHRYALIVFKDEESVLFATECMDGIRMFGQELSVRPKQGTEQERKYKEKAQQHRFVRTIPAVEEPWNRSHHRRDERSLRSAVQRDASRRINTSYSPSQRNNDYYAAPYQRLAEKHRMAMNFDQNEWMSGKAQQPFMQNEWNAYSPILRNCIETRDYTPQGRARAPRGHEQGIMLGFHTFNSAPDLIRHWDGR